MSTKEKKLSKTAKKKRLERRMLNNRRGIILISLLAAMILVVTFIISSYSWFRSGSVTAHGAELGVSAGIRSEKCSFETYQGTLVTADNWDTLQTGQSDTYKDQDYYIDQVAYNDTPIAENIVIEIPKATVVHDDDLNKDVTVPGRVYFRTNIQNNDTKHPSVISLYHHNFPANLGLAVTYPSNTYFFNDFGTDNGNYPDCWILRNAYVKVKDAADVDGPGLLVVEWFVENLDTENTKSIRVTRQTTGLPAGVTAPIEWLYLMYN